MSTNRVFQVTGEKVVQFLNGQLTNDIAAIKPGESQYNLLLTVKGKIVSDLFVYRIDNDFYLAIPSAYADRVMAQLGKTAPLSRVQITETNKTILPEIPDLPESLRIEQSIPKMGVDFTEANFPQEAGLEKRAVSFTKGCYLGQEIVARLQYRGHVNKILVKIKIDSTTPPPPGTPIFENGKECGKITSAIYSPKEKSVIALGYLPYGFQPGKELKVGESSVMAYLKA